MSSLDIRSASVRALRIHAKLEEFRACFRSDPFDALQPEFVRHRYQDDSRRPRRRTPKLSDGTIEFTCTRLQAARFHAFRVSYSRMPRTLDLSVPGQLVGTTTRAPSLTGK